ncbi:MAG: isopenicillin N synthase-like dioxygenase [Planctomycetota bacterium]|jgi:isopenicillin N synthase-like dioxygenase
MLPVLDLSDYRADPTSERAGAFVQQLREVCHGPGFFYLVGHGVEPQYDRQTLAVANRFFNLPLAEREALAIANSAHFRGYTLLESEMTNGRFDWRDQIDIGPEEPALNMSADDPPWLRLRGPNQWPGSLPDMRQVVDDWMQQIHPVGMALMQALAQGLGQAADYFDARMSPDAYTRVKIIRYPAQPDADGSGQGLGLHHDSGIMTFILQDEVPGLQVMSEGKLVDVEPYPGAYVINLGEMMQSATNGYLRATKHQVVSPPAGKQRISVAYFMNPRLDAEFNALELPAELATAATGGQNTDAKDRVYSTFGANTLKIRMRAHPDVTAKHYAGVNLDDFSQR